MAKNKYYAVRKGRKTGIFRSWSECKKQVDGFKGAKHKSFGSEEEAKAYLNEKKVSENLVDKNVMDSNTIEIYVDGSYDQDYRVLGYGCIMVKNSRIFHTIESAVRANGLEDTWNIAAEVSAALEGVKWAIDNNYKKIYLYYDYTGIENFADGSWTPTTEITTDYTNDIKEYQKEIDIEFIKVKAHSGNFYNEMVDDLAKKAVEDKIEKIS
ncbi:ribonuclease H1 domain-containing protein [Virgibacillus alimentarius]|uniref:ribonuclease H1 domain-containing protein n=1 Tax=Virgibacillus alimentarius TaxID=698769 RepID=UPI000492F5B1|nr:ribonuclease H family protein [Virgibacillus alimentarius]